MGHWHVATGPSGYGPEGSDGYGTATDARELASLIQQECNDTADFERQGAENDAEIGDFESAWKALKNSEWLSMLALNFDYDTRAMAPLYVDNSPLLDETIYRLAGENFPHDFRDGNSRVYVWECVNAECEHLAELDED